MKHMKLITGLAVLIVSLTSTIGMNAVGKADEPQTIEIHGKKFSYQPSEITLVKGVDVQAASHLRRRAPLPAYQGIGLNGPMKAGEFNDMLFTPEQSGDFKADCGLYCGAGHTKMSLVVHVSDK